MKNSRKTMPRPGIIPARLHRHAACAWPLTFTAAICWVSLLMAAVPSQALASAPGLATQPGDGVGMAAAAALLGCAAVGLGASHHFFKSKSKKRHTKD